MTIEAKKVVVVAVTLAVAGALAACSPSSKEAGSPDATAEAGGGWEAAMAENPSDPYVASYQAEDPGTLISMHKKLGYTCATCHDEETQSLVGSFDGLVGPSEETLGTREFCLNDGCHDWAKIKDAVVLDGDKTIYNPEGMYNVHDNHRGDVDCGQCHSMHGQPTLNCVQCHYMDLPEGWDGFE